MNTSTEIGALAEALAKAQGEVTNPAKASTNPHFKSRYADLATGLATVRPVLAKHGLSVVQMTTMDGETMMLNTRIMHSSGQWIEAVYPVCKLGKHQEMGSALTYSRRYALFAAIGVAGEDEDDDANTAAPAGNGNVPTPRVSSNALKKNNPDAWPTLEKAVRAATTREELNEIWKTWKAQISAWPSTWQEQADDLFVTRAGEVAGREAAE